MVKMLTMIGQLKRKGKFDLKSEFMKPPRSTTRAAENAISEPNGAGSIDPNLLLYGNLDNSKSILDDVNGNQESMTSNVGDYTPTEFPLEAKLMQPSYALDSASPSS